MPLLETPEVIGGPGGPDLVPAAINWSAWVRLMVTTHLGLILGLFVAAKGPIWPKRALVGAILAQKQFSEMKE